MLKTFVRLRETGYRLGRVTKDESGVVSFEYIIVAACIIGAVAAAFGTGTASGIGQALQTGITDITTAFTNAVTGA